jgi:hypothetical protein
MVISVNAGAASAGPEFSVVVAEPAAGVDVVADADVDDVDSDADS